VQEVRAFETAAEQYADTVGFLGFRHVLS
jgi:hypothetical protein